jgi:streptogramin lyase
LALLVLSSLQAAGSFPAKAAVSTVQGANTFTLSSAYKMVLHTLPTNNSSPWAISVDPKGTVWFLEESTNRLGSYAPSTGTFQEYSIPTPSSHPQSVTTDGDGNVWFTELASDRLGELPHGSSQIIEYPVPGLPVSLGGTTQQLSCGPGAIFEDPSGPIWLACLFSNQVDEFFPTNRTFASFDLPVFPSGPAGLLLDKKGDLWFTAADANMLGKAVVSELRNGTADGITEFAPLNQTYLFRFIQQSSFLGGTETVTSSLPTPSGIALDGYGRLWVTEHTDSSFDSYDPTSGSLVRYWTSQTHGAFGFKVSFPNGVAVGKDDTVWIAEHYGNRVAELDPSSGELVEYPSCCSGAYAGIYTLALGPDGTPWFVEIQGNAIGELVPSADASPVTAALPTSGSVPGSGGTLVVPIVFTEPDSAASSVHLLLDVSGISASGALQNMTASFGGGSIDISPGQSSTSNLTLATNNLSPGVYYITLTASASPQGVLYSVILKVTVLGGNAAWLLPVSIAAAAVIAGSAAFLWSRGWPGRFRRVSSRVGDSKSHQGRCMRSAGPARWST